MNSYKKNNSFIAISDFHGYEYPLDKIKKNYINEYDKIYILGDATDRGEKHDGTGSIKLLIEIMNLSKQFPDRIIYIPGNHDEFLLGYIRSKYKIDNYYPYSYTANLLYNGGEATIKELNELQTKHPNIFIALISWLGKQPIQRKHKYNNKKYVFGHAVFNQRLFDLNPNYCLEDYFKESENSETRRMANAVLWFRKFKNRYNQNEMPTSDKIMIIGHTPETQRKDRDINLTDANGRIIKVHCVDGGIAYNGGMLKYDGKETVIRTEYLKHNNTSTLQDKVTPKTKPNNEAIFQSHIICTILNRGKLGFQQVISGDNPKDLNSFQCQEIIEKNINTCHIKNELSKRSIYIKTFLFDYILENQIKRMQEQNYTLDTAVEMIDTFINGNNSREYIIKKGNNGKENYYHITSKNYAREIAKIIGPEIMLETLTIHNCRTVKEYVEKKYYQDNSYKNNNRRGI